MAKTSALAHLVGDLSAIVEACICAGLISVPKSPAASTLVDTSVPSERREHCRCSEAPNRVFTRICRKYSRIWYEALFLPEAVPVIDKIPAIDGDFAAV
ncbi:hypothetical protein H6F89_14635 [Cyanobacteria bacterium FACHB-63]|nr:hypothetical protein [Cyanobacteria bacterium FACHB-63]